MPKRSAGMFLNGGVPAGRSRHRDRSLTVAARFGSGGAQAATMGVPPLCQQCVQTKVVRSDGRHGGRPLQSV